MLTVVADYLCKQILVIIFLHHNLQKGACCYSPHTWVPLSAPNGWLGNRLEEGLGGCKVNRNKILHRQVLSQRPVVKCLALSLSLSLSCSHPPGHTGNRKWLYLWNTAPGNFWEGTAPSARTWQTQSLKLNPYQTNTITKVEPIPDKHNQKSWTHTRQTQSKELNPYLWQLNCITCITITSMYNKTHQNMCSSKEQLYRHNYNAT